MKKSPSNNNNNNNTNNTAAANATRANKDDFSEDSNSNTTTKTVEWSIENEEILVEWCDIAQCYKWLNTRAHNRFSFLHAWFTIPTIILSTITGTASFGQNTLPEDIRIYSPLIIGTVNIFIGILTTIQQYLKISELNESHRVMSIAWDKFARNIKIEISKAPTERMDAGHFIKHTRQEFDRLMETSPIVPLSVIGQFKQTFVGKEGSKEWKKFKKVKKPDICDTLTSSNTYRHHWYIEKLKSLKYKENSDSEDENLIDEEEEPEHEVTANYYYSNFFTPISNIVSSAKMLISGSSNNLATGTELPLPKIQTPKSQTHNKGQSSSSTPYTSSRPSSTLIQKINQGMESITTQVPPQLPTQLPPQLPPQLLPLNTNQDFNVQNTTTSEVSITILDVSNNNYHPV